MYQEDRTKRILELRVKNERKNIVKTLNPVIPNVTLDSFVEIEETKRIKELIYRYMDDNLPIQEEIPKGAEVTINKLMSLKTVFSNYLNETVYLFYDGDREAGGISLKLNDFYCNIEFIMDFTNFSKDFSDLLIIDAQAQFNFGLCIERQEYNNVLVYWAI